MKSSNSLKMRKLIGRLKQFFYPNYSFCKRCNIPWPCAKGHVTEYKNGMGCFPLCEQCWQELTSGERLPYYRQLYTQWELSSIKSGYKMDMKWKDIEVAVLKEK